MALMQNLRDQLLKAGLITEEQRQRAEARAEREARAKKGAAPAEKAPGDGSKRGAPVAGAPQGSAEKSGDSSRPKPARKDARSSPVNRMVDLSDPRLLRLFQLIEEYRLREDPKGDVTFHFTLRDGRVRKILITEAVSEGLEAGRLAIVESGDQNRHVIVVAEAAPLIRDVDPEAVRFCNA